MNRNFAVEPLYLREEWSNYKVEAISTMTTCAGLVIAIFYSHFDNIYIAFPATYGIVFAISTLILRHLQADSNIRRFTVRNMTLLLQLHISSLKVDTVLWIVPFFSIMISLFVQVIAYIVANGKDFIAILSEIISMSILLYGIAGGLMNALVSIILHIEFAKVVLLSQHSFPNSHGSSV